MAPRVSVVCRNWEEDRVIPRMARLLRDRLGWTVGAAPDLKADLVYLLAYFEVQKCVSWPKVPVAAYFTHREEAPAGNAKAKLYDEIARKVDLRVAMCRLYGDPLSEYGPTVIPPLPVEDRFRRQESGVRSQATGGRGQRPVVGLSGYTYANHRKGEDLVKGIIGSEPGQRVEWRASGRGWPVPTKSYSWAQMPEFYQGLDVLVCPSRVEGGPMPVLEAMASGVRVVAPRGVGILDELPVVDGLFRYERGDLASMIEALARAVDLAGRTDAEREGLRAAVAGHTPERFVDAHGVMAETLLGGPQVDGGIALRRDESQAAGEGAEREVEMVVREPVERGTGSQRGIYCVAFGEAARACCLNMMLSAKKHMPDVPICLCGAAPIGPEDLFVQQPDSDVGARRAKLMVYELTPAEWKSVLYLDADTEVVAPIYKYFEWVEDGWELAICQDIQSMETLHIFERKACKSEVARTLAVVGTPHTLQYNGGAWSFRRCERTARFFARWRAEWERYAQRDQGALLRALHTEPLRVWVLGNEWNTFPKFQPGLETAGLLHFPGDARRWGGAIPGRIDSKEAWAMVRKFEAQQKETAARGNGRHGN